MSLICESFQIGPIRTGKGAVMRSGSNILTGGDSGILAIFSERHSETRADNSINLLIGRCADSKAALSQLYIMFKDSVFAIAFSIIGDYHLSEDCVAETFVRLTQLKKFSPDKGDGRGIIVTVARNTALELRRRYRRDMRDFQTENPDSTDLKAENSIYLNQLMSNLNDKQRQIVVMKCCAELTFKDIARIMRLPESTVKSRYRKAMDILKEKAGDDK